MDTSQPAMDQTLSITFDCTTHITTLQVAISTILIDDKTNKTYTSVCETNIIYLILEFVVIRFS